MAKSIVIYFTSSGTTKRAAEAIQKATGAEIAELTAKTPYPSDYQAVGERGKEELDNKIHPEININSIPELSGFEDIYVGFPTWWSQPPMIIYSLFEQIDFSNKTIIPFTTSMSSTIEDSMPYMKKIVSKINGATLLNGVKYENNKDLTNFLKQNNLI